MNYKDIANKFNINIKNEQLFIDAFTHSSFSNEKRNSCADYERIEFVGDGVLDLIIADLVFQQYPNMKQGEMTKLRANLVCSSSLAKYAKEFGFCDVIRLGHGEILAGGPNQKILEDVFEAFVGATYLDQGFDFTKKMIESIFNEDIRNYDLDNLTDFKSRLQEYLQANLRGNIIYRVIKETGTSQDKMFFVEVSMILDDGSELKLGKGEGRNKKQAEEKAAKDALSKKAGK